MNRLLAVTLGLVIGLTNAVASAQGGAGSLSTARHICRGLIRFHIRSRSYNHRRLTRLRNWAFRPGSPIRSLGSRCRSRS